MSSGISASGRKQLAAIIRKTDRLVAVAGAADALGVPPAAAAKQLAAWAAAGWLRRVRRGLYLVVPLDATDPSAWTDDALYIADAVWAPCYFTGWTAAGHWHLTDQIFETIVVKTSNRVRRTHVQLAEHDYLLLHARESTFWGLEPLWVGGRCLRMADVARTVIDVLDRPKIAGGIRHVREILTAYLDEHPAKLLLEYADRFDSGAVFKRLGYLASLAPAQARLSTACLKRVSKGMSLLDPDVPARGRRDTRWGLRLNVALAGDAE